jgi:hypothetical protein
LQALHPFGRQAHHAPLAWSRLPLLLILCVRLVHHFCAALWLAIRGGSGRRLRFHVGRKRESAGEQQGQERWDGAMPIHVATFSFRRVPILI